jgi:hypothetical protein
LQPKRKLPRKAKQIQSLRTQLEIGKIYKIITKLGEVLPPAFFYFRAEKTEASTQTISAKVLRVSDEKAWPVKMKTEIANQIFECVSDIELVVNHRELTKVKLRGM